MMRKSFGGSYGGGGGNGGEMIRNVGRIVRTRVNNFQESLPSPNSSTHSPTTKSSSTTTRTKKTSSKPELSLSSTAPSSSHGRPLPVFAAWPLSPDHFVSDGVAVDDDCGDNGVSEFDRDWECLDNYYDPVFGVVPSTHEVQHALFSLQQVLHPPSSSQSITEEISCDVDMDIYDQTKSSIDTLQRASSKGSDTDWIEPSVLPYDWKLTQSPGWGRVHEAFHLLQTEPNVQRMVVSLSSDKAVWDAVLNNEAVREIRDSYRDAAESFPPSSKDTSDSPKANLKLLKWIFENMKMKLLEVLGNISQFVSDIHKPLDRNDEQSFAFGEKLKSTFLLTVVVLLIVVVARGHKA